MTMRMCIGIPTLRRVDLLRDLLYALGRLAPLPGNTAVEIAVFDNDPLGSAETVVMTCSAVLPFAVHYRHVSATGLSNVRNAALRFAESRADLLVMIDDDEIPEPQWLNELLRVRAETGATVVVGAVRALLPNDAPDWMQAYREQELPTFPDGASLRDGWSGNFLLDLQQCAAMGLRFDPAMNRTGGEDQLFFKQLLAHGGVIRYAASATAWESLPAARRSLPSIVRRSFCRGAIVTICDRRMTGSLGRLMLRFAKGGGLVALGIAKLGPAFVTRGVSPTIMILCDIARGLGMLVAFTGLRCQSYGSVLQAPGLPGTALASQLRGMGRRAR